VVYYHPFLRMDKEVGMIMFPEKSSVEPKMLDQTDSLWELKGDSCVSSARECLTPELDPVSIGGSVNSALSDRRLIADLSYWFESLDINPDAAGKYAELLVLERNTKTVTMLRKNMERNSNYLEEVGDFHEDDIIKIKEALQLPILDRGENSLTSNVGGFRTNRKVSITNFHGRPLTAEGNGTVSWNRPWIREWETFEMIEVGTDKVAFKSHHGLYLSAQPHGTLECNRGAILAWEMFQIVPAAAGGSAFRTCHGYYVCVTPHGLCEPRLLVHEWETFRIQNV
jgi:hypothetical protein